MTENDLKELESLIAHIRQRNERERAPDDPEECDHRIYDGLYEDEETGEVCENYYCDLDGNCPFPTLWEDCELVEIKEVNEHESQ